MAEATRRLAVSDFDQRLAATLGGMKPARGETGRRSRLETVIAGRAEVMARRGSTAGPAKIELGGAVFAGGQSRRMGRDKALLRVGGTAMWRRQADVLRKAGAKPVVILRGQGQPALGRGGRGAPPNLRDQFADAGPLAGLHAALTGTDRPFVAVLAVDMPEIDAAWFRWLGGFCHDDCGAVVRHHDGYEPLAAIYPRGALATVTRRLQRRALSMQELVRGLVRAKKLTAVILPECERWRVKNWNHPADRRAVGPADDRPSRRRQARGRQRRADRGVARETVSTIP